MSASNALTYVEDAFALAVIEYGGNLGAAYRATINADDPLAIARAREMVSRPEIAKRIREITEATEEHALISLGSHLVELAKLRDLSVTAGNVRAAIKAEELRGEAAGFYTRTPVKNANQSPGASVMIQINHGSPSNVDEWAARNGTKPRVIDV